MNFFFMINQLYMLKVLQRELNSCIVYLEDISNNCDLSRSQNTSTNSIYIYYKKGLFSTTMPTRIATIYKAKTLHESGELIFMITEQE